VYAVKAWYHVAMPYKDAEARKAAQRRYWRRKTLKTGGFLKGDSIPHSIPEEEEHSIPHSKVLPPFRGKSVERFRDYMAYITERGYTLEQETHPDYGYPVLHLRPLGVIAELEARIKALEQATVQHQADHVLREAGVREALDPHSQK